MIKFLLGCALLWSTWYGQAHIGKRHAASWHGKTPAGFSEVVTMEGLGAAASSRFSFGTRLRVTRVDTGASVVVTVVDRMRDNEDCRIDLWPAAAGALGYGPSFGKRDAGVVKVEIEVLQDDALQDTLPEWPSYVPAGLE